MTTRKDELLPHRRGLMEELNKASIKTNRTPANVMAEVIKNQLRKKRDHIYKKKAPK